ncbi:hypothetical protein [Tsukamurella spumae]|uniref:Uncharacterized protein n=1 Tax=Tsukamurella spumae TaxID=44753 RepID=A0A846X5Z6_9ACTN|nr:hypothetical protein [Tsukamurella spumae]NKY20874.1 hypothetical protein [Tsukamurella spumae]
MIDALDQLSPTLAQYFPPHYVRERADWVGNYGHGEAAVLRQQRLAARARRGLRSEAGTGAGAVSEERARRRLGRRLAAKDRKVRGAAAIGFVEVVRLVAFGPALLLGWLIYAVLYQRVPAWGPLRWRHLSGAAAAIGLATALVLLWTTSPTSLGGFVTWWIALQVPLGVAYAARLAWLWGWEAVTRTTTTTTAPSEVEIDVPADAQRTRTATPSESVWGRIKTWTTEPEEKK